MLRFYAVKFSALREVRKEGVVDRVGESRPRDSAGPRGLIHTARD